MVPAVTSNTPAWGSSVGTGDGGVMILPVASSCTLQLFRCPLLENTSAVLAIDVLEDTFILALIDLCACAPAAKVPIVQVTVRVPLSYVQSESASTNVRFDESVSVILVSGTLDPPWFLAMILYTIVVPDASDDASAIRDSR